MTPSFNEFISFVEKHWHEKHGLAIALVLATSTVEGLLVAAAAQWWVNILILALALAFIGLLWWLTNQPPKTPIGKIGFLVSIACTDSTESEKVKEDFILPLRRLIKSGEAGADFDFMQMPPHLANRIVDQDEAQIARIRSKAHFMVYGHVRLRNINGKENHVIEMEGLVTHKEVAGPTSKALAHEFAELFPRRVNILAENDLLSFQFTSEWAEIVAKYILGIAAFISADLVTAEKLYAEVQQRLNTKEKSFPVYQKLSARLPIRLAEVYGCRAEGSLNEWIEDHQIEHIEELSKQVNRIGGITTPTNQTMKAIEAFLVSRDVSKAIESLKKVKNLNDGVWHYNMAFLHGYKGSLKIAARHYNQASLHAVEPKVIGDIEDFICWVLKEEPDKYQLYFCLGLFNWKTKGDLIQARKDFQNFLGRADGVTFLKEQELAAKWIDELAAT